MVNSNAKGDRLERELINILAGRHEKSPFERDEWAVMRAPSSGSSTDRELPDMLAGNGKRFYAFEAKSGNPERPIYLTEEEVDALIFFAGNFGAIPEIAIRFDREPWAFFDPDAVYRTPGGNYRVKLEDVQGEHVTRVENL